MTKYSEVFLFRPLSFAWSVVSLKRFPLARFLIRQRVLGFDIPNSPHFDSVETTEWFTSKLLKSRKYLEYGSGGSTYFAAKNGISFISIDSDRFFLGGVKDKIAKENLLKEDSQVFHYADIGLTGPWGYPVFFKKPSAKRLALFRKYSDVPSDQGLNAFMPDLVLVDGRFRVACALKTIRVLANRSGWTLVVDDYVGRPHYHIISRYAKLSHYVGRMAVFTELQSFVAEDLDSTIRLYETIPD